MIKNKLILGSFADFRQFRYVQYDSCVMCGY